ncbi:Putative ribonuclease H protein At1g65750, partial [Linum perenne]
MFTVAKKLKSLKEQLKSWNINVFKRVYLEIDEGLRQIDIIDKQEELGPIPIHDRLRRIELKCLLDKLWKFEEISWKQKVAVNWLRMGDRNSKFFHRIANFNRRRNFLDWIEVDGIQVNGQVEVAKAAVDFFSKLYFESRTTRPFPMRVLSREIAEEIPLSTTLRGGTLLEWNLLIDRLDSLPNDLIREGPPSISWPLENSGVFSVRSLRRRLSEDATNDALPFPHDVIWTKTAPTKVQAFPWMVYHKKLATVDNLQRRGIPLVNRCPLCLVWLESVDHLLWQCSFAMEVWQWISSALSVYGPLSFDVRGLIAGWK